MPHVQMLRSSDTTLVSKLPGHIRVRVHHTFYVYATTQFQIVLQLLRLSQELTPCGDLRLCRKIKRAGSLVACALHYTQLTDLRSKSSHSQSRSRKPSILSQGPSPDMNVAMSPGPSTKRTVLTNCRQLLRSGFFNRLHLHRTTDCESCLLSARLSGVQTAFLYS